MKVYQALAGADFPISFWLRHLPVTSHLRHNLLSFLIKMGKSASISAANEFRKLNLTWRGVVSGQYQGFVINVESVDSSWSEMGVDQAPPWPLIGQMSLYWPLIGRWWPELRSCQGLMVSVIAAGQMIEVATSVRKSCISLAKILNSNLRLEAFPSN